MAVLPLSPYDVQHDRHERRNYPLLTAANRGPSWLELGKDPLAELVAGSREGERDVCMQAFETLGTRPRTADAEVQLRPHGALLCMSFLEAHTQARVFRRCTGPALD